ncbi:MAG: aldolase [Candidatus Falkowbacteria bacterium]|nr:aldolase [Candidatus Falkowbacteria bacterium]
MKKSQVPLSVPKNKISEYRKNWQLATRKSGKLLLFAGDQKLEHLNDDFFGPGISPEDKNPRHLFEIASHLKTGVFASHLGLIARYGEEFKKINYVVKLNGRTNLFENKDSLVSPAWHSVEDVCDFAKQSGLRISGVGYTIYLGGENETVMIKEAAKICLESHQNGILAIIWIYPRGSKIKNEDDPHLIAGAAGVASALGADFVKVKYPYKNQKDADKFSEVTEAAGNCGVICVGGAKMSNKALFSALAKQAKQGTRGVALGRNLHQRPLKEATALLEALEGFIQGDYTEKEALMVSEGKKVKKKKGKSKILFFF